MAQDDISYAMNKRQAARYFKVSPTTVTNAVKKHRPKPINTTGQTELYELKDLAQILLKPIHKVRSDRNTFDSRERKAIASILAEFGDMKQYQAYQQALAGKQKRELEAGRLMEGETVIATIGAVIGSVLRFADKLPNIAEEICPAFTKDHSKDFDKRLAGEVKTLLLDANGMIDDANKQLHDAGTSD